jgi:hypothetical protein
MKKMNDISSTSWYLLAYSKDGNSSFDWKDIRDNLLGNFYHKEMNISDVLYIILSCVDEIVSTPNFNNIYGKNLVRNCMMEAMKIKIYEKTFKESSAEEFTNRFIWELMSSGFRLTRADWCKDKIDEYKTKINNSQWV